MTDAPAADGSAALDDAQLRLDEATPSPSPSFQCVVCGRVGADEQAIAACHSYVSPSYRAIAPDAAALQPPRRVLPNALHKEFAAFVRDAAAAVVDVSAAPFEPTSQVESASESAAVLAAATRVVQDYVALGDRDVPAALDLCVHLLCLQTVGVLPGYPRYTSTIAASDRSVPTPIPVFCSDTDVCPGRVTSDELRASPLTRRDRVYRAKVWGVTDQFFEHTPVVSSSAFHAFPLESTSPWEYVTFSSATYPDSGYQTDVGFGDDGPGPSLATPTMLSDVPHDEYNTHAVSHESAAHNVIVAEAQQWVLEHPVTTWTSAPFVTEAPDGLVVSDGGIVPDADVPPLWQFDFASFGRSDDGEERQLEALGVVVADEEPGAVYDSLLRIGRLESIALVVMRTRAAVVEWVAHGIAEGWFDSDVPASQFARQPSLLAVNAAVHKHVPRLSGTYFLTRKQLIDRTFTSQELFQRTAVADG